MSNHDFYELARKMEDVYGVNCQIEVVGEDDFSDEVASADYGCIDSVLDHISDICDAVEDWNIVAFECPECGEPIYCIDWLDDDSLEHHCCPICGFEFEINE